jgi:hypothetical protein
MESGGRAAKLGNSYERLWAVDEALAIIAGLRRSSKWEPVGEDEEGVDLAVTDTDGTRTAWQFKRENGSKECWSVADQTRNGVLPRARARLEHGGHARFVFVSSCGARHLRDLAEHSRRSDTSLDVFMGHVRTNPDRQEALNELMITWGLDPGRPIGAAAGAGDQVSNLLLRLDGQCAGSDTNMQEAGLDAWDSMLLSRVGFTNRQLTALDD